MTGQPFRWLWACRRRATRVLLVIALAGAAAAAPPRSAAAQEGATRPPDAEAVAAALGRLEPRTRAEAAALVDSARRRNLPVAPLLAKVVEGSAKAADPARIVRVLREMTAAMGAARFALGPGAPDAEIAAAASAVQAGIPPTALRRMRAALRPRPATNAFVVAADLVRRGVPAADAITTVTSVTRAGASDAELSQLRIDIAQDVASGVPARTATATRVRQFAPVGGGQPVIPGGPPGVPPRDPLPR